MKSQLIPNTHVWAADPLATDIIDHCRFHGDGQFPRGGAGETAVALLQLPWGRTALESQRIAQAQVREGVSAPDGVGLVRRPQEFAVV